MPEIPSASKWTKLGPCVDWFISGMAPHHILQMLFDTCFTEYANRCVSGVGHTAAGWETLFEQDINWHAVNGSRLLKSIDFLHNHLHQTVLVILAIAIEPLRFLMNWLISSSSESMHYTRPPPICDMVNEVLSPIITVRQYYATLLSSANHPRLLLLTRACRCANMAELRTHYPDIVARLRRVLLAADSWVYRKHFMEYDDVPWKLSTIGDERVPMTVQMKVAREVFALPDCCTDEFFTRRLRLLFPWLIAAMLACPFWSKAFQFWAGLIKLTICTLECRHGRNRRSCSGSGWKNFQSSYCNREARTVLEEKVQEAATLEIIRSLPDKTAVQPCTPPVAARCINDALLEQVKTSRKPFSAWKILRIELLLEKPMDPTSADFKALHAQRFRDAPIADLQRLQNLADVSASTWRDARKRGRKPSAAKRAKRRCLGMSDTVGGALLDVPAAAVSVVALPTPPPSALIMPLPSLQITPWVPAAPPASGLDAFPLCVGNYASQLSTAGTKNKRKASHVPLLRAFNAKATYICSTTEDFVDDAPPVRCPRGLCIENLTHTHKSMHDAMVA